MTAWTALIALAAVMAATSVNAAQRGAEPRLDCSSYTSMTGTTTTECRQPGRKPTHCTSYTNINGTTKTECR
jgi:hypothetical protein